MKQVVVWQRPRSARRTARHDRRSGQALIEFAVIAFVSVILLGGVLTVGLMLFSTNALQQAADVGAMELARHPYEADGTFNDALRDSGLFTEAALVVAPDTDPSDLPLINRLLFHLYVFDPDINQPTGVMRYPGTVVRNEAMELTVVIPIAGDRTSATAAETITEWHRVVEEIIPDNQSAGPYSLTPSDPAEYGGLTSGGFVALRINYPHQSGASVAYVQTDLSGTNVISPDEAIFEDDVLNFALSADDGNVQDATTATFPDGDTLDDANYTLFYTGGNPVTPNPEYGASPHRGTYGLGELQAHATTVRPYRKVLSAQGIYRREAFKRPSP